MLYRKIEVKKMRETISLCMIVKNEEDCLETCLKSVEGLVDEMIIVDTGSTDNTIKIAEKFHAKVFHFDWIDDFGAARDFARKQATKQWVLYLDADEYLTEENVIKMKRLMFRPKEVAYALEIKNLAGEGKTAMTHVFCRLYKNINDFSHQGRIHEQICYKGKTYAGRMVNIEIHHTGYQEEVVQKKNKSERNMKILKKIIEKEPEQGFHYSNLAEEYLVLKEFENALHYAMIGYEKGDGQAYHIRSIVQVLKSYLYTNECQKGIEFIEEKIKGSEFQNSANVLYMEASLLEKMGRLQDAKIKLIECMKKGEVNAFYQIGTGLKTILPLKKLINIAIREKDYEKIDELFLTVLQIDKFDQEAMLLFYRLLKRTLTNQEVVNLLHKFYYEDEMEKKIVQEMVLLLRLKEGIKELYENKEYREKNKNNEKDFLVRFYHFFYQNDIENMKEILVEYKEDAKKYAFAFFIYGMKTNDFSIVYQVLKEEREMLLIADLLTGKSKKEVKIPKKEYFLVLEELIQIQEYDMIEIWLSMNTYASNKDYKMIANLFEMYFYDEMAYQYYGLYLQEGNDDEVVLKMIRLSYALGKYEETILYINKADEKQIGNFEKMEIIIFLFEKNEEIEIVKDLIQQSISIFPHSPFLKNYKQKYID